jgi:hypothetical protein
MAPMASRTHWQLASNVVTAGETSASRSPGRRDERHVQGGKQDANPYPSPDDAGRKAATFCLTRRLSFISPVLAALYKTRFLAGGWKGHVP